MAYGLIVNAYDGAGNAMTQIDTTKGLVNFVVTRVGTGSLITDWLLPTGLPPSHRRILFVKHSSTYLSNRIDGDELQDDLHFAIESTTNLRFKRSRYLAGDIAWSLSHVGLSVDWFIVEDVTGLTPTGDYGLQVKAANGDIAFDSRMFTINKSCNITSVKPAGSVSGAGTGAGSLIHSDAQNTYVSFNWSGTATSWTNRIGIQLDATGNNVYHLRQEAATTFKTNWNPIFLAQLV